MGQHYFVVAWDEKQGWFIDQDMAENTMGDGLFYDEDQGLFMNIPEELAAKDGGLYGELSNAFKILNYKTKGE